MAFYPMEYYPDEIKDISPEIGKIEAFMRTTAPRGYLICNGGTYNIVDYPLLTSVFIQEFGSVNYFGGDGTATFAVPDLRGEFLRGTGTSSRSGQGSGSNVGVHQDQGLPNITGRFGHANAVTYGGGMYGAISVSTVSNPTFSQTSGTNTQTYDFNASRSNALYGKSSHVTPTNTSVLYCIRAY